MVLFTSVGLETPRFFQFELVSNGTHTDYWTTDLMEEPTYIQFSAYWDVLITKGGVPLLALIYFNLCMILKIRASSKFSHRFVGRKSSGMGTRAGAMHGGHAGVHGGGHGGGHGGSTRRKYSVALCRDEFLSSGPPTEMIALRHQGSFLSKTGSPHCRSNLLTPLAFREKEAKVAAKVKPETVAAKLEEGEDAVDHVRVRHGREWPAAGKEEVEVAEAHGLIVEDEDDVEEDDPAAGASRPLTKLSRSLSSANTTPSRLSIGGGGGNLISGSISRKSTKNASNHFQKRREKSTLILVLIVLIFIACHSYRLSLKIYEFSNPENNTEEHFLRCTSQGRYHIPVVFYVLVHIHHLVLVLNSSINFIIYCCVGKEFRMKLVGLFCREKNPVIVW